MEEKLVDIEKTARKLSVNKPTPLDFDIFIPWICKQWEIPVVVEVTRMYQEDYKKEDKRRSSSIRSKSTKSTKFPHDDYESCTRKNFNTHPINPATSVGNKSSDRHIAVPLIAYYDSCGNLVALSIISAIVEIHKKIIEAINICIPFHPFLNKLTISKGGISYLVLYKISKLLSHSNLTEICLDNSYVPEGNHFILLDHTSQLKYLSLNRCQISDVTCKQIANRIDFWGTTHSSLLVLQLSSNLITDIGARYLGNILRRNRRLLHLNLSGNKITDFGMEVILKHLMEFKLTANERFDAARRKIDFTKNKDKVLTKCMEEAIRKERTGELSVECVNKERISMKINKCYKESKKSLNFDEHSHTEIVGSQMKEIIKEYEEPFDTANVVKKDGYCFSLGNMVLCSLNVAYNELTYASVKLLETVLYYQSHIPKRNHATGLIRVILDGNFIPKHCFEYDRIGMHLKKVVYDQVAVNSRLNSKKRTQSVVKK